MSGCEHSELLACLSCGSPNDCHHGRIPGDKPTEGNFMLCACCGTLLVFTADGGGRLGLRWPTKNEKQEAVQLPELRAFRAAVKESYTLNQALDLWRGGW